MNDLAYKRLYKIIIVFIIGIQLVFLLSPYAVGGMLYHRFHTISNNKKACPICFREAVGRTYQKYVMGIASTYNTYWLCQWHHLHQKNLSFGSTTIFFWSHPYLRFFAVFLISFFPSIIGTLDRLDALDKDLEDNEIRRTFKNKLKTSFGFLAWAFFVWIYFYPPIELVKVLS
jgi:hypothetical protein